MREDSLTSRWTVGRLQGAAEIPSGWQLERLVDVSTLESGHTPARTNPTYWDGDIPWVSLHDTSALSFREIFDTKLMVTNEGISNSSARVLPKGTVALSRTATVGKAVLLGREMATSQDFACFLPSEHVETRYLLHLFKCMAPEWRRLSAGSTHQTIYMPIFKRLQVLLPPSKEQRRIAEILDTIDEAIQASERVIEKRRELLRGLQQRLLGDGPGTTTVNDLVSRHWPGEWGEESPAEGLSEVLVLRATNLSDYSVDYATAARRFVPHPKTVDKRLEDGDLLLEGAGGGPGVPVGRVARFRQPDDDSVYLTSNFFRALRPAFGVDTDYLYWLLDYEYRKPSIWSCQQQTTGIINLKLQDYLERQVGFRRDRQVEVAGVLNEALRAIDMECAAADKLRQTRAGLAIDLFSGRVRTVAA